jgi:cell wall-associated NlpC family hydrolase
MEWVREFIGIPYKDKGRDYDGADCWGLAFLVSRDVFARTLPYLGDNYTSVLMLDEVHKTFKDTSTEFTKIAEDERQPGDLIVFRITGVPVHVGIIIDKNRMVHTLPNHNSAYERYDSVTWSKRIEGYYRWES